MRTSVTRSYFKKQQICKTKTKTRPNFLVSDRSWSKNDDLRPHHWCMHENLVMYLNTRKSSLNFGTHTDIEQNLGFFEETFTVVDGEKSFCCRQILTKFSEWWDVWKPTNLRFWCWSGSGSGSGNRNFNAILPLGNQANIFASNSRQLMTTLFGDDRAALLEVCAVRVLLLAVAASYPESCFLY